MSDIYEQHQKAFAQVSAWVILDGEGERVATVAMKFPRDGAGRLYCYLHVIGSPMVRGYAGGYGYDKRSAAFESALERWSPRPGPSGPTELEPYEKKIRAHGQAFRDALKGAGGSYWYDALQRAGYDVMQAV